MDLMNRLQGFDRQIAGLEALRAERERRLRDFVKEVEALEAEVVLLTASERVLQVLAVKTVAASTEHTDRLVTMGLKAVFHDLHLEFQTKVGKARGKTAAEFQLLENGKPFPIEDSFGGGVLAVVGVLLRVCVIVNLKLRRVLILDETLAHLSDAYHHSASELLRSLAEKLGFQILMVTHSAGFTQAADRHYHAKKTTDGLVLELKSPAS